MDHSLPEFKLRGELLARALADGQPRRALDLGTGTGSLAIALEHAAPGLDITAVDVDREALERAHRKAGPHSRITWVKADAGALPFEDGSFELITCSLMLHHLHRPQKQAALGECLRVLAPGGLLQVADWGRPQDPLMAVAFLSIRLLDGWRRTREHATGELPKLIADSGFGEVVSQQRTRTVWGTLELLAARRGRGTGATVIPSL